MGVFALHIFALNKGKQRMPDKTSLSLKTKQNKNPLNFVFLNFTVLYYNKTILFTKKVILDLESIYIVL